ncbi:MAG TPA: hypothetical protein PKM88_13325, partial [bacterium]|nr:hypothetical protein [bacterium]
CYYVPSLSTAPTAGDDGDVGYFMVAVEDESGKVQLNTTETSDSRQTKIARSQGFAGSGSSSEEDGGMPTNGQIAYTDCMQVGDNGGFRTVQEVGIVSGISVANTYYNRSILTPYPNANRPGITYDRSGRINVNSATRWALRAVRKSGGTYLTSAQADAIISERATSPFLDNFDFNTRMSYSLDETSARFDSLGWYRVIARGVMIPKGDPSRTTAESTVETYIKCAFESDNFPVQICYWREWWELPKV